MASPISLNILPKAGLQIEIINFDRPQGDDYHHDPNDSQSLLQYQVTNTQDLPLLEEDSYTVKDPIVLKGYASPTSNITLPKFTRKSAFIPEKATRFAYLHPPDDLASRINWEKIANFCQNRPNSRMTNKRAKSRFSIFSNSKSTAAAATEAYIDDEEDGKNSSLRNSSIISKMLRKSRTKSPSSSTAVNPIAIAYLSLMGGFIYFDDNLKILRINAISTSSRHSGGGGDSSSLELCGPFEPHPIALEELHQQYQRSILSPVPIFHEAGVRALSWIRPNETFLHDDGNVQVIHPKYEVERKKNGGKTRISCNDNGAFVFWDNFGGAVVYNINPESNLSDPEGETALSLQDSLDIITTGVVMNGIGGNAAIFDDTMISKSLFFGSIDDIREGAVTIKNVQHKNNENVNNNDDRTQVHRACRAGRSVSFISELLENRFELKNLTYTDDMGWTPLHYASYFALFNPDLIELLMLKCPKAILVGDRLDRCPLHLACEAASRVVVDSLRNAEGHYTSSTMIETTLGRSIAALLSTDLMIVDRKTKYLKYLPLHIACSYSSTPSNIIEKLLDADETGGTVRERTSAGRLPIHFALATKLHFPVIQKLLEADSKWVGSIEEMKTPLQDRAELDLDVYRSFKGMLPLHIACLNNSSQKTIRLLLNKDKLNVTIDSAVLNRGGLDDIMRPVSASPFIDNQSIRMKQSVHKGMVALHFAAKHGSEEVIRLLLNKEASDTSKRPHWPRGMMVQKGDGNLRTPLHIACSEGVADPSIIQMLLESDPLGMVTQEEDEYGQRPIHCACGRKNPKVEIVKILLETEEAFLQNFVKNAKMAIPSSNLPLCCDEEAILGNVLNNNEVEIIPSTKKMDHVGYTPLFHALKSNASDAVIDVLLQPDHFFLKGLDDAFMMDLAHRVNDNPDLRALILDRFALRFNFSFLFVEFYAFLFAIFGVMYGTEDLLFKPLELSLYYPIFILISSGFFIIRELIQVKSVSLGSYIYDAWSWMELISISFLLQTAAFMLNRASISVPLDDGKKLLLIATTSILTLQFVFFLRSTFLPFARFVGGLILIIQTLIPFLIISILVLQFFSSSYRIQGLCGQNHCWYVVLGAFFNGGNDFEEETNITMFLEILFGISAGIILLNVVIAIVAEGWDSATEKSLEYFWNYRLRKISEVRYLRSFGFKVSSKLQNRFDNWIDVRGVTFSDEIAWSKSPYNLVKNKNQYDDPHAYFRFKEAKKIEATKSLQADYYWIRMEREMKRKERNDNFHYGRQLTMTTLKWLSSLLIYAILVLLGFVTAGLFWPKNFRIAILSVGIETTDGEKDIRNTTASTFEEAERNNQMKLRGSIMKQRLFNDRTG